MKRKVAYSEKYKKGVTYNKGRKDISAFALNPNTDIHLIEAGKYDDGKEFMIIKLDNL